MPQEDLDLLENYSAGINKVVSNLIVWPPEFYLLWNTFEPWTPGDSLAMQYILIYFSSSDWFGEFLRERLLEIYDKPLVDRLIPFKRSDFQEFQHNLFYTISDAELDRIGMLKDAQNSDKLYEIDENLLHVKPRKQKLDIPSRSILTDDHYRRFSLGSNCYGVHGNHTQSGKPLLACDPHNLKVVNSIWYLTRLSWNETDSSGEEYKTYMLGGSIPSV